MYAPVDTVLGVWFPGTLGGATWSGVSFDPSTGYVYVNANEVGAVGMIRRRAVSSVAISSKVLSISRPRFRRPFLTSSM